MADKVVKPGKYEKNGYSPQTETARVPVEPKKQEGQKQNEEEGK